MSTKLDHIVIGASTLEEGADYIRQMLGVDIPEGGRHEMMGTYNKVMSLGNGVYLEVIAINPEMQSPDSPRWFGLDDPHVRRSLSIGPGLLTWAVNTSDIERLVSQSAVSMGEIRNAQRDNLKWKVAVTEDGRMPGSGFIPLCIQWQVDFHPSEKMQQLDCQFKTLTLYHPYPKWLDNALGSIGANDLVKVIDVDPGETPRMELVIRSPRGDITISSTHHK